MDGLVLLFLLGESGGIIRWEFARCKNVESFL